ncbi:MAG: hypothetical protein JWO12_2331, partial [Frankiales bacterium]|nr:hypothetical protein [Frankiales bacterium]
MLLPTLLPATAASADVSSSGDGRLYLVVADRAPHSTGGLYLGPSLDHTDTPVLSEEDGTSAVSVTAARAARRFAAVEYRYDPSAPSQQRNNTDVVVYESSGDQVELVATSPINSNSRVIFTGAALSPDGTQVVWSKYTGTSNASYSLDLYRSDIGSGVITKVSGGADLEHPAYLDGTTLIATNHTTGAAVTLPAAGGDPQAVSNDPTSGGADFVVSPDGSTLAWDQDGHRDTEDGYRSRDVYTAPFTLAAGTVAFGPSHQVTSSRDNRSPAWETDTQLDLVSSDPGPTPQGDVETAPADGSTAPTPVDG